MNKQLAFYPLPISFVRSSAHDLRAEPVGGRLPGPGGHAGLSFGGLPQVH